MWFIVAQHHALGCVLPVYSNMPLVPAQLVPAQQLMSLNTLRWVVALITNHVCLRHTAATTTAAVPIIDGILQDSSRPISPSLILIWLTAWVMWFKIGKHFALPGLYYPYKEKWQKGLLSISSSASPYLLNTENSATCSSSFIYFAARFFLPHVGQLIASLFSPPAHFFLLVYNLYPSFLGHTETSSQVLMSLSQHLSADSGKGGSRAADLLRQRPQGWGLWNVLDVQSSGCHKDRPVRLGCQQCLWRYVGTSTSNVKRILSTDHFPSALTHCHSRGAILDILNILWISCFRSPFVPC